MTPLRLTDVIPYAEYERQRDAFRREIIALKGRRRISIGEKVTLLFENRDTIRFQVQEMIRAERIFDPAKVQAELDVYNKLIPAEGELSATLFIEITDSADLQRDLDAFQGIDGPKTLSLVAGTDVVYGEFEAGRSKEDKISAVHFVTFRPSPAWVAALTRSDRAVAIRIDHPAYRREVMVPSVLREEWCKDLGVPLPPASPSD
ncbi:DUF3501 family protein [Candidatus Nitrospira bockiana]